MNKSVLGNNIEDCIMPVIDSVYYKVEPGVWMPIHHKVWSPIDKQVWSNIARKIDNKADSYE